MKNSNAARSVADDVERTVGPAAALSCKGFSLSDREFEVIRSVIRDLTGISMGASKRQLIYRRLEGRLKARGIGTVKSYLELLQNGDLAEREAFSNAVTTNLTSFFRENHHFDFLAATIIPELVAKYGATTKRLRIWSAGCSTGEEPYSIAITLTETLRDLRSWDAKLLCTDLDSDVLNTAKTGEYANNRVEKISPGRLKRWFRRSRAQGDDRVRVTQPLKDLIVFNQLNLMNDWPMRGRFDVIFCRNVVIYFDKPTQRTLMERFANSLEDGGYLILGHSESLFNVSDRFKLLGNTVYRKTH